jgi:hypothetical protein
MVILAAVLLSPLQSSSSRGCTEIQYDVLSKGLHVGNSFSSLQSSSEGNTKVIDFSSKTEVNASFLWMGYHLSLSEHATVKDGNLVKFSKQVVENGKNLQIEGHLEGKVFHFDVVEDGRKISKTIPRSDYDYTATECPEATIAFGSSGEMTLRILDAEKAMVVKRKYRLIREDTYVVGDKDFHCRIVEISDQNKTCRRWIGKDGDSIIIFRQDGKGKQGSYSLRVTSLGRS